MSKFKAPHSLGENGDGEIISEFKPDFLLEDSKGKDQFLDMYFFD